MRNRNPIAMLFVPLVLLCISGKSPGQVREQSTVQTNLEHLLIEKIEKLERRIADLEAKLNGNGTAVSITASNAESGIEPSLSRPTQTTETARSALEFLSDTTFNVTFDGYYGYNFNRPVGGVNLLRAYDVMSNSFSLNQAAVVIENAPNLEKGKRHGFRLDLQYGQATETVQGNAANEPRPNTNWRMVFFCVVSTDAIGPINPSS